MPETAVAPAPAAAPAAPALGTIPIGTITNIPTTPAFKKAAGELRSGKYGPTESKQPETKQPDAKLPDPVKPDPIKAETTEKTETEKTEQPPTTETKTTDEKGKETKTKISPWKLVDEWKGKHSLAEKQIADLQTQLADLKTKAPDVAEAKKLTERLEKAEARAKQLEDEVKFADYSKSDEYRTQYEKPYQDAWKAGQSLVSKMNITTQDGTVRKATPADWDRIMEIHFQDPETAANELSELFGAKASVVSSYMVDVEKHGRKAANAIDEYRTKGAERWTQQQEDGKRHEKQISEDLSKSWDAATKASLEHPEYGQYFKQREGDPEWNQRLAKGYELADRAFRENAKDPNLTPEQRKSIVNRHAALKHRAAAFGALRYDNQRLRAENAELRQQRDEYGESEPTGSDGKGKNGEGAPQVGATAMARARAALHSGKYAR